MTGKGNKGVNEILNWFIFALRLLPRMFR
jgi:hypothetical protein